MKRSIFLSLALITALYAAAETNAPADFRVICKDGTVQCYKGADSELTFNDEGTLLHITHPDNVTISYAVEGIEAIEFAASLADKGYAYDATHIAVTTDPADDTSYGEVKEEVITDDLHDDYGDFIENYEPKSTVVITYNGNGVTYTGNPAGVNVITNGAHVTITSTKKNIAYTLKGTTDDGSFKLYSDKKTQITLSGVNITNPTGAAINVQSGKTMMVHLADGTTNTLEDGTSYTLTSGEQQKGTFFSEGQLVFSGKGTLNITSHYGHGIASDDYVRLRDGNITISSVRDGINTKDRFIMYGGNLTIDAGQDGVDVGEGYIEIGGGRIVANAVDEAITASYEGDEDTGIIDPAITPYIAIKGGLIKVTTTGDKGHALRAMSTFSMSGGIVQATTKGAGSKALMSEENMSLTGGKITAYTEGNALYEDDELSSSAAIRSKSLLTIDNMSIGLKSTGKGSKGINNEGNILLESSDVKIIATGEDDIYGTETTHSVGISTDGNLTVKGGRLLIKSSHTPIKANNQSFIDEAVYEAVTRK